MMSKHTPTIKGGAAGKERLKTFTSNAGMSKEYPPPLI